MTTNRFQVLQLSSLTETAAYNGDTLEQAATALGRCYSIGGRRFSYAVLDRVTSERYSYEDLQALGMVGKI